MNMDSLLREMAANAANTTQNGQELLREGVMNLLEQNRVTLEELMTALSEGEICEEEFSAEIEREKALLEAELLSLQIVGKPEAQKAITAAMDTLTQAVKQAI
ncbi:MAG: hypothetical protein ACEPOZ_10370 [Marinifilaceae bacterium]